MDTESLPEGDNPLPGTGNTTLDHDEVVLDDTVVRPSTERVDGLLGDVSLGSTGSLVETVGDSVDLLVHLGTVMVTILTRSSN